MSISKKDLEKLKARLPRGYTALVSAELRAKQLSATKSRVSDGLSGKVMDLPVIEAAIVVAERHEKKLAELASRMRGRKSRQAA